MKSAIYILLIQLSLENNLFSQTKAGWPKYTLFLGAALWKRN